MLGVSIIVPTYNERGNIAPLLRAVRRALGSRGHEIIVVDDGSPDGTGRAVRDLQGELADLRLIEGGPRRGIGAALRRGYDRARCELLLSLDADLSFDPADIPRLLEKIDAGFDLVVGSRHGPEGGYETPNWRIAWKAAVSAAGNRLVNRLMRTGLSDCSANFRCLRRSTWEALRTTDSTNSLLLEMILEARARGFRVGEIPVFFGDRRWGRSKINIPAELPRYFLRLIRYFGKYRLGGGCAGR